MVKIFDEMYRAVTKNGSRITASKFQNMDTIARATSHYTMFGLKTVFTSPHHYEYISSCEISLMYIGQWTDSTMRPTLG